METATREVAPTCTACGSEHNGEGSLCFSCGPSSALKQWIVEIWEKAEHWSFSTTYEARSSDEARSLARAQYGRGYTIRGVCRGAF